MFITDIKILLTLIVKVVLYPKQAQVSGADSNP